jgi:hypothetical protein
MTSIPPVIVDISEPPLLIKANNAGLFNLHFYAWKTTYQFNFSGQMVDCFFSCYDIHGNQWESYKKYTIKFPKYN